MTLRERAFGPEHYRVGQALHSALSGKRRMSKARVTRELQGFMQRVLCIDEDPEDDEP